MKINFTTQKEFPLLNFARHAAASLLTLLLFTVSSASAQTKVNIAPLASVSAFGGGQAPYQWSMINDKDTGTFGVQQAFVWSATPPDGSEYMIWQWSGNKTFDQIKFYNAQNNART